MKKLVFVVFLVFVLCLPQLISYTPLKLAFVKLLEHKLEGSLEIDTLRLSWLGPQRAENIRFKNQDLDGTIPSFTSPLPFWQLSQVKHAFSIENGSVQVHAAGYPEALVSHIHAVVQGPKVEATATTTEEGKTGSLKVRADKTGTELDVTANGTNVPTVLVDRLVSANGKLAAVFGPSMNGTFTLKTSGESGTVTIDIDAPNTDVSGSFAYTPSAVTLKEPLLITCQLSPELGTRLLNTKLQSQTPVLLRIFPDGFVLPRPFSLDTMQIAHATLDLGKFQIENTPAINSIFNLLKSPRPGQWVNAWFTSADAALQKGTLSLGRVDALIGGSLHLCAWGDVMLSQDKLAMNLGIPADTLQQAFGIQNLGPDYVLKIPVQGTIENPEFVTGPASAKIAAMVAGQVVQKPGPVGTLFGILNAATSDSGDVPPAKRPFPWEK